MELGVARGVEGVQGDLEGARKLLDVGIGGEEGEEAGG